MPARAAVPEAELAAHAQRAQAALRACNRLVHGWWAKRDPQTDLLPENLQSPVWTPQNSAADLWPFLLLCAHFTEPGMEEPLLRTLRSEIRHTTRVGPLPDSWHLEQHRFVRADVNLEAILFGAAEYAKDGLLPMCELLGRGPWFERLRELEEGIFANAPVETAYGRIPANDTEVNGEVLQVLSRLIWATGDRRLIEWAERIGDAYCLEMIPRNGGLPAHRWDFAAHRPTVDRLSLNDHGNEIVGGLSELHFALKRFDPAKAAAYEPALRRFYDTLLEKARNPDGLWFQGLEASTQKVLDQGAPDTWGYALSGCYTFGLATGEAKYREAAGRALRSLNQPRYHDWGGADAFADSIESGLLLLNRIPAAEGFAWLDVVVPRFLAKQKADGIVEGWHGDGNFGRTALMVALYHTQGVTVRDWRPDLLVGAARNGQALEVLLKAGKPWAGRVCFDAPRHRLVFNLGADYPRLNQFPEWWTAEPTGLYTVRVEGPPQPPPNSGGAGGGRILAGCDLHAGMPFELKADTPLRLRVEPVAGPPYGDLKAAGVDLTGRLVVRAATAEARWLATAEGGEVYAGERYLWTGRAPIEVDVPGPAGDDTVLELRWGAKGDERVGRVLVNGKPRDVRQGGYNGFRWVAVPLWVEERKAAALKLRIEPLAGTPAAFIAAVRMRR